MHIYDQNCPNYHLTALLGPRLNTRQRRSPLSVLVFPTGPCIFCPTFAQQAPANKPLNEFPSTPTTVINWWVSGGGWIKCYEPSWNDSARQWPSYDRGSSRVIRMSPRSTDSSALNAYPMNGQTDASQLADLALFRGLLW